MYGDSLPPPGLSLACLLINCYGSCRSLSWQFVGVGVPALVGLLGLVLMAAPPQRPGGAVRLVAAGLGDDGPAKLSQQLRNGDGDQALCGGAGVAGALAGGGHSEEGVGEQADRGPAVPGGPGGDLAAVQPADLLRLLVLLVEGLARKPGSRWARGSEPWPERR